MNNTETYRFDYAVFKKRCRDLSQRFPFLQVISVGKSVMGKDILALVPARAKKYSLIVGGLDGRSAASVEMLFRFTEELCSAFAEDRVISRFRARPALVGRGVIILPCLNPDGCELASLGKIACGDREQLLCTLAKNGFEDFPYNARGKLLASELSSVSFREPEAAALGELVDRLSPRHMLIIGQGDDELIIPRFNPDGEHWAELLEFSPFPPSNEETRGLGIATPLSRSLKLPVGELLLKRSSLASPERSYPSVFELLMLSI